MVLTKTGKFCVFSFWLSRESMPALAAVSPNLDKGPWNKAGPTPTWMLEVEQKKQTANLLEQDILHTRTSVESTNTTLCIKSFKGHTGRSAVSVLIVHRGSKPH